MWLLIGCFSLFGANSFAEIDSGEEALFLRRIADFWQEGEYGIAKKQLEEFLIAYPQSPFSSLLHASLGDLLLREKNFSEALAAYSAISSPDLVKRTFLNRMECLYNLEWYATLADECEACLLKQPIDADTQEKTTFYLAIALYQQCLSANKEPQILYNLAKRAEPYFEILLKTDLSSEIAHAFSHLCCILKEYEKAANLYLDLAAKEPAMEEEMTFQAALIQAQYDKSKALETLAGIAKKGQTKGKEAAYNCMVLFFESGRYEELIDSRDSILASIAEEKKAIAHYFLGRSLIHLEKYREAAEELTTFLALDPENDKIAKGRLLLAQVLKKIGQLDAARTELNALIADCSDLTEQATLDFEWADLEYQAGNWKECRLKCHHFLRQFPSSEWTSYAWRLLVSASGKLSCESLESKEQFILDLEALLREQNEFPIEERCDWQFYLGQAYFHLGQFEKALFILEPLLQMNLHFSQKANARLAFGLCERDFKGDLASFCLFGEEALQQHADLMETGLLHAALFNAYLELSKHSPELLEKSAAHLYDAFLVSDCVNSFKYLNPDLGGEQSAEQGSNLHQVVEREHKARRDKDGSNTATNLRNQTLAQVDISRENLLWLGNWYVSLDVDRAIAIFSHFLQSDFDETACYQLGKLYASTGQTENQIAQLETLMKLYNDFPESKWRFENESRLLLAKAYQSTGCEKKALSLLEEVAIGPILDITIAEAYLEKALAYISQQYPEDKTAPQLKNLILQKRLEFEPIHLEAALKYVELLEKTAPNPLEKRLFLLEKVKSDFEKTDDVLSKDYHYARLHNVEKNQIYEDYMNYIDHEIFLAKSTLINDVSIQKELQAKAKDFLLQIKCESSHPWLIPRVIQKLALGWD